MELLSPAGSMDALHAAVDNGANAVYLGYTNFGARASAVNFDDDSLHKAVNYAHLYHARIYVTVNTLVKPDEFEALYQTLKTISDCRADAVLVQDLAVAQFCKQYFPALQLHASTQMGLCNATCAEFIKSQGFSRIVLARECSLQDIRTVCATGIETEVFVHGALCTAVSGRCLMSSMAGGRSGNRGRCAQPCRQNFKIFDTVAPWLSLRDLSFLEYLPELQNAGVTSLKIEGRLKSPEYVSIVTQIYRKAMDELEKGTYSCFRPEEMLSLRQIFNRGSFTRGHAMGAEDSDLVSGARVSHEGIVVGKITSVRKNFAEVTLEHDLHNEDSLQLRGKKEYETRYSGPEVSAGCIALLRLRDDITAEKGMTVARLADSAQLHHARQHAPKPIPVQLHFSCSLTKPVRLEMTDGISKVMTEGALPQEALNRATDNSTIQKQLLKLGGTPFCATETDLTIENDGKSFLSAASLNALRREAVAQLEQERIHAFSSETRFLPYICRSADAFHRKIVDPLSFSNLLAVMYRDLNQAERLKSAGASLLIYDAPQFTESFLECHIPKHQWLRIPPQLTQQTVNWLIAFLQRNKKFLAGLWIENIGLLHLPVDLPVIAGEGIPICSSLSGEWIKKQAVSGYSVWPEWTAKEAETAISCNQPVFLKVYGRETLMYLHHCPKRAELGLNKDRSHCRICTDCSQVCGTDSPYLNDLKGHFFPLTRTRFDEGCEINVLNCLPTDLSPQLSILQKSNLHPLLRFTTETAEECAMITKAFADSVQKKPFSSVPNISLSTLGHWLHGVE